MSKHTGENRIRNNHDKAVEMLSKAMASNMLGDSTHITKYNEDIIHDMAKKIKSSMNLSNAPYEVVNKALESPEELDALAILKETIPGMKDNIDLLVERINVVRKATEPGSEKHVDLNNYGVGRAIEAKKKRSRRDQGIKEEKPAKKQVQQKMPAK